MARRSTIEISDSEKATRRRHDCRDAILQRINASLVRIEQLDDLGFTKNKINRELMHLLHAGTIYNEGLKYGRRRP